MGIPFNPGDLVDRYLTKKLNEWFKDSAGVSRFEEWWGERPDAPENFWEQEVPGQEDHVFRDVGIWAGVEAEFRNAGRTLNQIGAYRQEWQERRADPWEAYNEAVDTEGLVFLGGVTERNPYRDEAPWWLRLAYEPGGREYYNYYDPEEDKYITTAAAFAWNQPQAWRASGQATWENVQQVFPEARLMQDTLDVGWHAVDATQHTFLHEPIGPNSLFEYAYAALETGGEMNRLGNITDPVAIEQRTPVVDDFATFFQTFAAAPGIYTGTLERYAEARRPENYYPGPVPPQLQEEFDLVGLAAYGTRGFASAEGLDVYYGDYMSSVANRDAELYRLRALRDYYGEIASSPLPLIGDEAPLWTRGVGAAPEHWPEFPDLLGRELYEMSIPEPRSINYNLVYQIDYQIEQLENTSGGDWLDQNINPWRQMAIMAITDWTQGISWGVETMDLGMKARRAVQARNAMLDTEDAARALGRSADDIAGLGESGGFWSWMNRWRVDNSWAGGLDAETFAARPAGWVLEDEAAAARAFSSAADPGLGTAARAYGAAPGPASVADDPFGGSWDAFWSSTLGASAPGPMPPSGDPVWDTSFVDPGFGAPRGPVPGPMPAAGAVENPFTSLLEQARANPGPFQDAYVGSLQASSSIWENPRGLEWSGEYDWNELEAIFRERFVGEGSNVMQTQVRQVDDMLLGSWTVPDANISPADLNNMPMYSGRSVAGPYPADEAAFVQSGTYEVFRAALTNDGWTFANEAEMRRFGDWLGETAAPLVPDDQAYRNRAATVVTSLVNSGVDPAAAQDMVAARFGIDWTSASAPPPNWLPDDPLIGSNTDPIRVMAESFYEPVYGPVYGPVPKPQNVWYGSPVVGDRLDPNAMGNRDALAELLQRYAPDVHPADSDAYDELLERLGSYQATEKDYQDFLAVLTEGGVDISPELDASFRYQVHRSLDQRDRLRELYIDEFGPDRSTWEPLSDTLLTYMPDPVLPSPDMPLYRGVNSSDTWRIDEKTGDLILVGQYQHNQGLAQMGVSLSTDAGLSHAYAVGNRQNLDVDHQAEVLFSFPASVLHDARDQGVPIWHKGSDSQFELFPETSELRIPAGQWEASSSQVIPEDNPLHVLYQYGLELNTQGDSGAGWGSLEEFDLATFPPTFWRTSTVEELFDPNGPASHLFLDDPAHSVWHDYGVDYSEYQSRLASTQDRFSGTQVVGQTPPAWMRQSENFASDTRWVDALNRPERMDDLSAWLSYTPVGGGPPVTPADFVGAGRQRPLDAVNPFAPTDSARILGARDTWNVLMGTFLSAEPDADEMRLLFEYLLDDPAALLTGVDARQFPSMAAMAAAPTDEFPGGVLRFGGGLKQADLNEIRPVIAMMEDDLLSLRTLGGDLPTGRPIDPNAVNVESTQSFLRHAADYYAPGTDDQELAQWLWGEAAAQQFGYAASVFLHMNPGVQTRNSLNAFGTAWATGIQTFANQADLVERATARGGGTLPMTRVFESVHDTALGELVPGFRGLYTNAGLDDGSFWRFDWLRNAVGDLYAPAPQTTGIEEEIRRAAMQYLGSDVAANMPTSEQMRMLDGLLAVAPESLPEGHAEALQALLEQAAESPWRESVDHGPGWNLPNPLAAVDEAGARAMWGSTTMWGTGGRVSWGEGSHFTRYYAAGEEWYLREYAPDRFGTLLEQTFDAFAPAPGEHNGLDAIRRSLSTYASDRVMDSSRKEFAMGMQEMIEGLTLPEADKRALVQMLTGEMLPMYDDLTAEARGTGMSLARFTMLEPGQTVNADNWLGPLSLFSYFPTRTAANWLERTVSAPHWAHWYHLYNEASDTAAQQGNYPERYDGMTPLGQTPAIDTPLGEIPSFAWMMSNPMALMFPFNVYEGDQYNKPEDAETLGELALSYMRQSSLNPSPMAEAVLAPEQFEPTRLTPQLGYMIQLAESLGIAPERLSEMFGDEFDEYRTSRTAAALNIEGAMTREQALWVQDLAFQAQNDLDPLRGQPEDAEKWYEQVQRLVAGSGALKDTARMSWLGVGLYAVPAGELEGPEYKAEYDYMSGWMSENDIPKVERDAMRSRFFQQYPGAESWFKRDDLLYTSNEADRPGRAVMTRHDRPPLPDLPGSYPWDAEDFVWSGDQVEAWRDPATGEIDKSMSALYRLFDPRSNETMYIGQTVVPSDRFQQHMEDIDEYGDEHPKTAWMRELANEGLVPGMQIVGWYPRDNQGQDWEKNAASITGHEYMTIGWMYYDLGMPYGRFGNVDIPTEDEYRELLRRNGLTSDDMWRMWNNMDGQIVAPTQSPDLVSPSPNSILMRGYLREDPWEHVAREVKSGQPVTPGVTTEPFTSIPGIGEDKSRLIRTEGGFTDWKQLALATPEELAAIEGIGPKTAQKIIDHAWAVLAWNDIAPSTPDIDKLIADLSESEDEKQAARLRRQADATQEDPYFFSETPDLRAPGTADFTTVEGIGEKTSAALNAAGYRTWADIGAATDDELDAVAGIGPVTISRLRAAAGIPAEAVQAADEFLVYLPFMAGAVGATELPGRPSVYLPIMAGTVGATELASQSSGFDDFEVVSGIGPKTEQALYDAGYTSWEDIAGASFDALDAVSGIGEKTIALLRAQAGVDPTTATAADASPSDFDDFEVVSGIGPKTEQALYDAGYTSWEDIAAASSKALDDVEGIGEKTIALLRAQAGLSSAGGGLPDVGTGDDPYFGGALPDLQTPGTADYTVVKGIGPKTSAALNAAGYYTWDDILAASSGALDEVEGIGPKTIELLYDAAMRGASGSVTDLRMLQAAMGDVKGGGVGRSKSGVSEIEPRWWEKTLQSDYRDLPHMPWVDFINPDGTWHINQQYVQEGHRWEKTGPPDPFSMPYVTGVDAQGNWMVDYDILREYQKAERRDDPEGMAAAAAVATATRAASGDPRWEGDLLTGDDLEYLPGIGKVSEQRMYGYGVTSVDELRDRGAGWIDQRLNLSDETRAKLFEELGLPVEDVSQAPGGGGGVSFPYPDDYAREAMRRGVTMGGTPADLAAVAVRSTYGSEPGEQTGFYQRGAGEFGRIGLATQDPGVAFHEASHLYWEQYRDTALRESYLSDLARLATDPDGGDAMLMARGFFAGAIGEEGLTDPLWGGPMMDRVLGHNDLDYQVGYGYNIWNEIGRKPRFEEGEFYEWVYYHEYGGFAWDDQEMFAIMAQMYTGRYGDLPEYMQRWFGGLSESDDIPSVLPEFSQVANLPMGPVDLRGVPADMRRTLTDADVGVESAWSRALTDIGRDALTKAQWYGRANDSVLNDEYRDVGRLTSLWHMQRYGSSQLHAPRLDDIRPLSVVRNQVAYQVSGAAPDLYTYGDSAIRNRPHLWTLNWANDVARYGTEFADRSDGDVDAYYESKDTLPLMTYGEQEAGGVSGVPAELLGEIWRSARLGRDWRGVTSRQEQEYKEWASRDLFSYGDEADAGSIAGAPPQPDDIPTKLAQEVKLAQQRPTADNRATQAKINAAVRKERMRMKEELLRELADEVILDEDLFP